MKYGLSALALALAALAASPLLGSAATGGSVPQSVKNLIQHEPLVVYDVTGSTLSGPFDLTVEVYNDGTAKISGVTSSGADARVVNVGAPAAFELAKELRTSGAWSLSDQPGSFSDVPLKTLTVLRGTSAQLGHSFSYWVGTNNYQPIEQIMQLFIAESFPGF